MFSCGDFSWRIYEKRKDEFKEIIDYLNRTAQKIEEKIKDIEIQNQQLSAILKNMVEGIILVDKDTRIISLNPSAERIFDISERAVKNKFFLEVIPNKDLAELIKEAFNKREGVSKELSLVWPFQKIFKVKANILFEKEEIKGCLLVIYDITEIRHLETVRKDFVANVSHELKTPLTAIKGFVETLLDGALSDTKNALNFLNIIQEHTQRLENLINDLLSLSYLESKESSLNIERVNFKALVEEALSFFKTKIAQKEIELENNLEENSYLDIDKEKMLRALTNLIDNAIKFNKEKGSIKISAEKDKEKFKFIIADTGIGIPSKDIKHIFERFYRPDKGRSRQLGGTGLGLSIVKHIIELHGGSVGVESLEGLGSKFFFILPVK